MLPGETGWTSLPRGCGQRWNVGGWGRPGSGGDTELIRPHCCPRHPGARTMLPLLLLLLPAAACGQDPRLYTPALSTLPLGGLTTTSTFVLDQPRCAFPNSLSDAVIWLVVAVPEGVPSFDRTLEPGSPDRAYQRFPANTSAYMTLNTTLLNYPCPKADGEISVLRVGSETSCQGDNTRPTCNGPLPGPGPYRVRFVAWDNSGPVAETKWSEPIYLQKATPQTSIPRKDRGHSAAMIALTSILTILFATLLAGLVAMLVCWGSDACGVSSTFSKPEAVTVQRYNTHHVYDHPPSRL
ncbi:uroplakin-3b-like protein 1 [Melopsittacus undulatus]|uniref:uroplakin-3b-like protein 1 n=1 Tax=Melopsittacus undulatus TaxID=13146 RepID=UPI00146F49BE|nr:uroplakin-3b-like protein 2 [Melopsittacus undulatus]